MSTRIKFDIENNAEEFWDHVRNAPDAPGELKNLDDDGAVVSEERAAEIEAWARLAPGYADGPEYAEEALLFEGFYTADEILEILKQVDNEVQDAVYETYENRVEGLNALQGWDNQIVNTVPGGDDWPEDAPHRAIIAFSVDCSPWEFFDGTETKKYLKEQLGAYFYD